MTSDAFDGSALQQSLVSLVAIKVAGLVLIFDAAGLLSFELPKALSSRAMEWFIAGALLMALLRYGPAIIPRTRLHVAVGAFLVVNLLATLFAENRYIALFGEEDHYLGLTFVVDMAVLYLAVAVAFRRFADWALFGGILAFTTALVLAYAAIQYFGLDPIGWNIDPRRSTFSTLGDADTLGRYFSLIFGASAGVAALGRGQVPVAVRTIAAVLALTVLAAAALSTVRGTLLGIAAALAALPFLYLRLRGLTKPAIAIAVVGSFAIAAVLAILLAFTPVGAKAQGVLQDPGTQLRLGLIDTALHAFSDRPVLGYGPDNFGVAYPRYRQPGGTTVGVLDNDAHNWLFQTVATTGALGVLALVTGILMSLVVFWRSVGKEPSLLGTTFLLASVSYWAHASTTIASGGLDWFPYVAFGAAATMGQRVSPTAQQVRFRVILPVIVVAAVAAAAGSATGFSAFLANRDIAVAAGDANTRPQVAVGAAESALRRDAGRAVNWYWLGRAQEAQLNWSAAAAAYNEAAVRSPYERAYWARLAQSLVQQAQGGGPASLAADAIAAARRGTEVDPNEPLTHVALANTAYALGQYDLSLRAAVDAINVWPAGDYDALVVRAISRVTDLQQARVVLEQALGLKNSAALHLALAQVALKLGDRDTARVQARLTLELAPGNTDAQAILSGTGP